MSDQQQNSDEVVYTLQSQPGIKRDGTLLEGEFCSDGQWVRFQRGKARKMGGFREITTALTGPIRKLLVWSRKDINSIILFSSSKIETLLLDNSLTGNGVTDRTPAGFTTDANNIWTADTQFDAAGGTSASIVLAHCNKALVNIDDDTASKPYWALASSASSQFVSITDAPSVSGGVAVLHPYTILFGSDGFVAWSDANQPQVWSASTVPGDAGTNRATSSKIVACLPVRSGQLAGLLWALDSVIRMDYIGGAAIWRFTPVSGQSSILAQNSVIEYDGAYFWIGVDRFMYFDSSVKELPNDMNQNWFFDNLNYSHAQKIWATKIPRFGEIIWFFPFGSSTECNRAIVFNVRLKTWYDFSLSRSAGFYSQVRHYPLWAGSTASEGGTFDLYQHEIGKNLVSGDTETAIQSYFVTQNFGYPTGGVGDSQQGANRWTRLTRVEPDFIQTGDMTCTVQGSEFAQSPAEPETMYTFSPTTGKIDMREQRRHVLLKFESNTLDGFYEAGKIIVHTEPGDNRS